MFPAARWCGGAERYCVEEVEFCEIKHEIDGGEVDEIREREAWFEVGVGEVEVSKI